LRLLRRESLGFFVAVATTGCLGDAPRGHEQTDGVDTTETPATPRGTVDDDTRSDICGGTRLDVVDTAAVGTLNGFEIETTHQRVPTGGTIGVRVRNRSGEERTVGVRSKFYIQRHVEKTDEPSDWRSVYYTTEDLLVGRVGRSVEPGTTLGWRLRLTPDGLTHRVSMRGEPAVVCEPLAPGSYRFVFWGLSGESVDGLATPFEIVGTDRQPGRRSPRSTGSL
jgi:hypothetical protein